jgi:transposase IS66-like protein
VIGESVSEMLDWIPAQLRVIRTTRPKYACPLDRAFISGVAVVQIAVTAPSKSASPPAALNPHSTCRTALRPHARFPGMGFFVKVFACAQIFCPSSVSLFDLKARFFVPTSGSLAPSRAGAAKVGRRASLDGMLRRCQATS